MSQPEDEVTPEKDSWVLLEETSPENNGVEEVNIGPELPKNESSTTPTPIESDTESISVISDSGSCKDEEETTPKPNESDIRPEDAQAPGEERRQVTVVEDRVLVDRTRDSSKFDSLLQFSRSSAFAFVLLGLSVIAHYHFADLKVELDEFGKTEVRRSKFSDERLMSLRGDRYEQRGMPPAKVPKDGLNEEIKYRKIKQTKKNDEKSYKKQGSGNKVRKQHFDKEQQADSDNSYNEIMENLKMKEKYLRKKEKLLLKKEQTLKKEVMQLNKKRQVNEHSAKIKDKENRRDKEYDSDKNKKAKYDKDFSEKNYFENDYVNKKLKFSKRDKYDKDKDQYKNYQDGKRNSSRTVNHRK